MWLPAINRQAALIKLLQRAAHSGLLSVTEVKAILSLTHRDLPLEVFWDKVASFNLFLLAVNLGGYDQISS